MTSRSIFIHKLRWLSIILTIACFLVSLTGCPDNGSTGRSKTLVTITGIVGQEDTSKRISHANCRFIHKDENPDITTTCAADGSFILEVAPEKEGYIQCSHPLMRNLNLSTFSSTIGFLKGETKPGENVTPTTTLVADIIRYENPPDAMNRKFELLRMIETGEDPNLTIVVTLARRLFKEMVNQHVNKGFGGGGGGDPDSEPSGVGGEAGDGADFSPLPAAECEFVVGDDFETAKPIYPDAFADYFGDGKLNRPDLRHLAEDVLEGLDYTPEQIQQAFAKQFEQGVGPHVTAVTDEDGNYFLPIPADLPGYVRCMPQGFEKLVLGTHIPVRPEGTDLIDQDVTPATTVFSTAIASRLDNDLDVVKENFHEDIDGLETQLIFEDSSLIDIQINPDSELGNNDVALVAFSVTALFNAFYKNNLDVDFLASLDDLIANAIENPQNPVDPELLADLGVPAEKIPGLARMVNETINNTGTDLNSSLDNALSTARVIITVMNSEGPIPGATVAVSSSNPNVQCAEGCDSATDYTGENGQLILTLSGVPEEATPVSVSVFSEGYDPDPITIEVVTFATVNLDLGLGEFNLEIHGGSDGNGRVTSLPSGIDCTLNGNSKTGACSTLFLSGTQVELSAATTEVGQRFIGWSGGGCYGSNPTCTVTVDKNTDITAQFTDDITLPVITVSSLDAYAREDEMSPDSGTFRIRRTGSTTSRLPIYLHMTGSATNGNDYHTISSTITIPAGRNSVDIPLTPIDNYEVEANETAALVLQPSSDYALGSNLIATIMIVDDDVTPVVTVAAPDDSAREDGRSPDNGFFQIRRTGNTASSLAVNIAMRGTANNGVDYQPVSNPIIIPAGQRSVDIALRPIDNSEVEPNETAELIVLSSPDYELGSPHSATITILDDDVTVTVTVTAPDDSAREGDTSPDSGTFQIRRTGNTASSLAVNIAMRGTANNGVDYQPISSPIIISAGRSSVDIALRPIDNSEVEPNETAELIVLSSPDYELGSPHSATIMIVDDDITPVVTVAAPDDSAREDGTSPDYGAFQIRRTGNTASSLAVNIAMRGTATNGVDYQPVSGPIIIPAGRSSVDIALRPIDNSEVEPNETAEMIVLSSPDYDLGSPNSATITILDDDVTVTVTAPDDLAREDDTSPDSGTFQIRRTGNITSSLPVNIAMSGTATNGVDYQFISSPIIIPAGRSSVDIALRPIDNNEAESVETAILTLEPGSGYISGDLSNALISIYDDE